MKITKGFLLCGVSATLLWCAFPPVALPFVVFIAFVPLFICSRRLAPWRSAIIWGLCGLGFSLASLAWFFTLRNYNVGWEFVFPGWCAGSVVRGLIFALFGFLDAVVWKGGEAKRNVCFKWMILLLVEPFLWTGLEWARSLVPGLEWNYMGTPICQMPLLSAPARWCGEIMLGALAVMVNSAVATALENIVTARRNEVNGWRISFGMFREFVVVVAMVAFVFVVAKVTMPEVETVAKKFVLVQRYAPLEGEMEELRKQGFDSLGCYRGLLKNHDLKGTDFLVLPESSLKEFGADVRSEEAWNVVEVFSGMADGAAVIAGGESNTPSPRGRYIQTAASLYEFPREQPDKEPSVYVKRNLVPFGEYNPLARWFPSLRTASYYVEAPGTKTGVFRSKGIKLAPMVCFDCSSSEYVRDAAKMGVQVIVLISNNLWYTPSAEPMQHFWQAVSRSVETGLPIVSAGNAGVTGIVDSDGSVRVLKDESGAAMQCAPGVIVQNVNIPKKYQETLFVRYGNVPLVFLFVLSFVSFTIIKTWE